MWETFKDKLNPLIEPVQTQFNRLSPRERWIVNLSVMVGVLVIALIILLTIGAKAASYQSKITKSQKNTREIHSLGKAFQSTQSQVAQLEAAISQAPKDFKLATEIEKIAQRNEIKIDSFKERAGPKHEFYEEKQVILSIKDVEIRALIDFLQAIEGSKRFMLITNLNVKPAFKDPTKLSVQAVISTFSTLEEV